MQTKTLVLVLAVVVIAAAGLWILASGSAGGQKAYFDANSPVRYFYSDQCHFCQQQAPILAQLAQEGYRVKPMDVLAHPDYWNTYNITGTPTFIASNGERQVGLTQIDELRAWLQSHNARIASA